jgi:hypothetical protein
LAADEHRDLGLSQKLGPGEDPRLVCFMKKLTKSQRRAVRTFSFPVFALLMMTAMMAFAGTGNS